jgi:uncharacterized protein YndB with AHSA1/START domain
VTELPGGARRLEFRRSWPDPITDVWSALTEPERLARWIGTYEGERGSGGTGTFTMTHEGTDEDEAVGEAISIVECDPPRRLVVEWTAGQQWRLDLDLSVEDGRTVLLFTQVFPPGTDVGDYAAGWHWYLDKFEAELVGRPQPADWDTFLAEVGPTYGCAPPA